MSQLFLEGLAADVNRAQEIMRIKRTLVSLLQQISARDGSSPQVQEVRDIVERVHSGRQDPKVALREVRTIVAICPQPYL